MNVGKVWQANDINCITTDIKYRYLQKFSNTTVYDNLKFADMYDRKYAIIYLKKYDHRKI